MKKTLVVSILRAVRGFDELAFFSPHWFWLFLVFPFHVKTCRDGLPHLSLSVCRLSPVSRDSPSNVPSPEREGLAFTPSFNELIFITSSPNTPCCGRPPPPLPSPPGK